MSQVVHVPYTVEQVADGVWRAHAQLLQRPGANGSGSTREEAIADLGERLTGLIAEVGAPEEMALTLDVAWPPPQLGPSRWWHLLSRWRSWRGRRRSQRFSLADWQPAIAALPSGQQRYIVLRWARSIELMDRRHGKDVRLFYLFRTLSILGGVAITALSGIGLSQTSPSAAIRWFIFALGFIVAGSAAMEQLGHYSQHRMLARQAREQLVSAGCSYLLPAANTARFPGFQAKVESILSTYNQSYNKTLSGT